MFFIILLGCKNIFFTEVYLIFIEVNFELTEGGGLSMWNHSWSDLLPSTKHVYNKRPQKVSTKNFHILAHCNASFIVQAHEWAKSDRSTILG